MRVIDSVVNKSAINHSFQEFAEIFEKIESKSHHCIITLFVIQVPKLVEFWFCLGAIASDLFHFEFKLLKIIYFLYMVSLDE